MEESAKKAVPILEIRTAFIKRFIIQIIYEYYSLIS